MDWRSCRGLTPVGHENCSPNWSELEVKTGMKEVFEGGHGDGQVGCGYGEGPGQVGKQLSSFYNPTAHKLSFLTVPVVMLPSLFLWWNCEGLILRIWSCHAQKNKDTYTTYRSLQRAENCVGVKNMTINNPSYPWFLYAIICFKRD